MDIMHSVHAQNIRTPNTLKRMEQKDKENAECQMPIVPNAIFKAESIFGVRDVENDFKSFRRLPTYNNGVLQIAIHLG